MGIHMKKVNEMLASNDKKVWIINLWNGKMYERKSTGVCAIFSTPLRSVCVFKIVFVIKQVLFQKKCKPYMSTYMYFTYIQQHYSKLLHCAKQIVTFVLYSKYIA